MTDNEIIKALELHRTHTGCYDCPYGVIGSFAKCTYEVMTDALDLINRLQAEKERKRERIVDLLFQIDELKAEIERLKLERDLAKFEKYKADFEEVKAEAIKDFAERLKESMERYDDEEFYATEDDIDNLLKEMVGDEK